MQKTFDEIFHILQQGGEVNFKSRPDGMVTTEVVFPLLLRGSKFQFTIEMKDNVDKKIFDTIMAERLNKCFKDIHN